MHTSIMDRQFSAKSLDIIAAFIAMTSEEKVEFLEAVTEIHATSPDEHPPSCTVCHHFTPHHADDCPIVAGIKCNIVNPCNMRCCPWSRTPTESPQDGKCELAQIEELYK